MVGILNKIQKFYNSLINQFRPPTPPLNPFAKLPEYHDKFKDALGIIKPIATVASTLAGFIPGVGTAVSAGITGAEMALEAGDMIYELNQSKNWDWSNLYDWENLANNPEQWQTLSDVVTGNYKGDGPTTNRYGGDFSGNFDYGKIRP
jgi:hypothetical protein